jgi:alkylhydroperoxidase family enzyme
MLLSPEVGDAIQQVGARIRFGTALTGRERELAILSVAGALRSDFERLAHEPAARNLGLAQAQIDAALAGQIPDGLSADEAMVCRLAQVMAADRTLPDKDYSDGTEALGRERLAELTWLVGYYGALALALAVFRPVLPESFADDHGA